MAFIPTPQLDPFTSALLAAIARLRAAGASGLAPQLGAHHHLGPQVPVAEPDQIPGLGIGGIGANPVIPPPAGQRPNRGLIDEGPGGPQRGRRPVIRPRPVDAGFGPGGRRVPIVRPRGFQY